MTSSSQDEAVDAVKNIDMSQIGDVGKFVGLAIGNAIQIIFIGYLGASMASMCDLTVPGIGDPETFHSLFPTNLDALPYSCPGTAKNPEPCSYKGGDVLTTSTGGKQWYKIMFEVLWPMNSLSFPYNTYYSNPLYQDTILYGLFQWMSWTCAGAFSKFRAVYKAYILVLAALSRSGKIGDIIVFYLLPYLTILLFVTPPIPQMFGSGLAAWTSVFTDKVEKPYVYAFAPLFGVLVFVWSLIASLNCCACACCSWVLGLGAMILSFCVMNVSIGWNIGIGIAIGFWSAMVTLFSPIMWKNGGGWADMKRQFMLHRRGLLIYFIITTACASGAMLSKTVATGVVAGGFIALYFIIFGGGTEEAREVKS